METAFFTKKFPLSLKGGGQNSCGEKFIALNCTKIRIHFERFVGGHLSWKNFFVTEVDFAVYFYEKRKIVHNFGAYFENIDIKAKVL